MIPQQIPVKNHYGNNVATVFDFDFYIENEEQLQVTHTDFDNTETVLELGIDYQVNKDLANDNNETTPDEVTYPPYSSITFPIEGSKFDILASDSAGRHQMLSISLNIPIEQSAEYTISSTLNKKNLEYSFDYLTRLVQLLSRKVDRSVKVGEGIEIDTAKLVNNINILINHVENIDITAKNKANIDTIVDNIEDIQTASANVDVAKDAMNSAIQSASNAKVSENKCQDIFNRLGSVIKVKGRVDEVSMLPQNDNLDGDCYLVGLESSSQFYEYYWINNHWEFLGSTADAYSFENIQGEPTDNVNLSVSLNSKQDTLNITLLEGATV